MIPLAGPALLDPSGWVRVDDPAHPEAIARSTTGAVLTGPPADGAPWRAESLPVLDLTAGDLGDPGSAGDAVRLVNADLWHADGVTGEGISVAVFDVGWFAAGAVDPLAVGAELHDCFVTPTCEVPFDPLRPHTVGEGSPHGWACAEQIRELAPGAELHAVRVDSFTMLENAVAWAVRERIDVISLSMSYYNDSFYDETGPHEPLVAALAGAGTLLVKSAGNDGVVHWQGPYVDADGDGRLDGDADGGVALSLDESTVVTLSWNQYGDRCGDTDLDLFVTDVDGNVVGRSELDQVPGSERPACRPVEVARPVVLEPGEYRAEVHLRRGSRVGLDVRLLSRGGAFLDPQPGSPSDPTVFPSVAAIGAVRASAYWDGVAEPYSSYGPTRNGVAKPDLAGPDGLSGTAFGGVGFFGTSASAPVVAGLVALVMEDDPELDAAGAFERLQAWAWSPSPRPGDLSEALGAGVARLPVRDPEPRRCGGGLAVLCVPLLALRRRS